MIRENSHLSALFEAMLVSPRCCPSIEDEVSVLQAKSAISSL